MQKKTATILLVLIWMLWLFLSKDHWLWFFGGISVHFDLLHVLLLGGILFFWIKDSSGKKRQVKNIYFNKAAIALAFLSLVGFACFKSQTTIQLFGFIALVGMAYGLLGFSVSPHSWRKGLVPFGLLLMTLPFGRHLDVFVGFPLRMASAEMAHRALLPLIPNLDSLNSLLVIENRASQVDMDCSGLKGLWVGTLIYFLISWLEKVKVNHNWAAGLTGLWLYLVLGNFMRITSLSLIHLYWQKQALDPWVHHSTSVFFLLTGSAFSYLFLRSKIFRKPKIRAAMPSEKTSILKPVTLPIAGILLTAFAALWVPAYEDLPKASDPKAILKAFAEEGWQPGELGVMEKKIYAEEGVTGYKFTKGSIQLILVPNGDWRSQHKPELCYELSGLQLSSIGTLYFKEGFPLREMSFKDRKEKAFYWFQNEDYVTEDYAQKVWEQVKGERQSWTLVSLLSRDGELPAEEVSKIKKLLTQNTHD